LTDSQNGRGNSIEGHKKMGHKWGTILARFWRDFGLFKKATPLGYILAGFYVIPLGFEPKTHSLEGCCSIQLSYGTMLLRAQK
jgi:hypothetical protein